VAERESSTRGAPGPQAPFPPAGRSSSDDPAPRDSRIGRRRFIGFTAAAVATLALGGGELVTSGCSSPSPTEPAGDAAELASRFRIQRVTKDPTYVPDQWRLKVTGLVETELNLTLADFLALPQTEVVRDFECVERWVVPRVPWEGVTVGEIIDRAGVRPEAAYLHFWSDDGVYSDQLSVEHARRPEVLLAHKMGGAELPEDQGWPVRLVVPDNWGYKSVKWVGRIEVTDEFDLGYWERLGYPDDATIVR
jgi:hypothetical protein